MITIGGSKMELNEIFNQYTLYKEKVNELWRAL